jgi:hypothetical protein
MRRTDRDGQLKAELTGRLLQPSDNGGAALAYGSRSTTAAEDNLNRLIHHERGRYFCPLAFMANAKFAEQAQIIFALPQLPVRPRAAISKRR